MSPWKPSGAGVLRAQRAQATEPFHSGARAARLIYLYFSQNATFLTIRAFVAIWMNLPVPFITIQIVLS
jgi:hypothetical protein